MDAERTVKLKIGTSKVSQSGVISEDVREVEFRGRLRGSITDRRDENRPRTETLYQVGDDDFVVHLEFNTSGQGETTTSVLIAATKTDLGFAGRFARLGAACGLQRALTLAQALEFSSKILEQQDSDKPTESPDDGEP